MGTDKRDMEGDLDDDALLEDVSNLVRRDCDKLSNERDYVQLIGTDGEAIHMEHDDDELLEEVSKLVRGDYDDLAKERDSSILEV
jgi:hypothetical protein